MTVDGSPLAIAVVLSMLTANVAAAQLMTDVRSILAGEALRSQ